MGVFDEESEEFKSLDPRFKKLVKFVNNSKTKLDKIAAKTSEKTESQEELKKSLVASKEIVEHQFKLIEQFVSLPTDAAVVSGIEEKGGKKFVWILQNGRRRKVNFPEKNNPMPGMLVEVSSQTAQIIDEAKIPAFGSIAKVSKILNEETCEVVFGSETKVVLRGTFGPKSGNSSLEIGDRVVLDQADIIILDNLGKGENQFKLRYEAKITWDDIVGQEEAKEKLIEMIELPYTHTELFKRHNKKQAKGALLLGPPGNGKTMLTEASATALAKIHGEKALDSGFMLLNAPDILEDLVGIGEKNLRRMFEAGEDHFEKHGYPAIIAIEEPDAVFIKRGTGKSSDVERSMVTTLLTQMNRTRSIVLMATNRPDILDQALVRAKRLRDKIYVGGPDKKSAAKLMAISLKDAPLDGTPEDLSEFAADEIFSEKRAIYEIRRKSKGEPMKFSFANLVSYADVADIADKATSITFRRDTKNNSATSTGKAELVSAIDEAMEEKLRVDHKDAVLEIIRSLGDDYAGIKELRQARN